MSVGCLDAHLLRQLVRTRLINLDCAPLMFDGGDCATKASVFVENVNSNDSGTWLQGQMTDIVYNTYRVYISLSGDATHVTGVFGSPRAPLVLPPAWQMGPPYGRTVAGIAHQIFDYNRNARFDSWLTIGTDDGSDEINLRVEPQARLLLENNWTSAQALTLSSGGIIWDSSSRLPHTDAMRRVLIAQLTTEASAGFRFIFNAVGLTRSGAQWEERGLVAEAEPRLVGG
eukprot:SAG31_NODE_2_length_46263_cov_45.908043_18_plen_229_part_00